MNSQEHQNEPAEGSNDPNMATSWRDMINTPNAPMIRRPHVDRTIREYTFVRTYKCGYCGNEWSEKYVQKVDEGPT